MTRYAAPLDDLRFALYDVLDVESAYRRLPGCEAATRDLIDAVLEEGARFASQVLAPLNESGDAEGCHFDPATQAVRTPKGFREAFQQYVEGGWIGLTAREEFGGQGLPETLGAALKEMVDAANLSWSNYPMLSHGASSALEHHGEDWQREVFLKPLVAGTWTGTMCLTEPHCGSDLGLLRTRAEPRHDGSYAISGTKIFITAGEHDLTENIVHLVLARLPDAPAGSRGISLFAVPKHKVDRQTGTMGERNALRCGALEHKMGIHGSATCVMNFDGAEGWLVGAPNKGLAAMFTMMNSARLAVGLQGLGLAERAMQNAGRYANERLQGRAPEGPRFPDKAADPITVHPDVRRMLLTQRALVEGSRALAYHAASLVDVVEHADDDAERARADALLGFLIPIAKACLTEWGVECTYHALQCFGGHGYIAEHGMEQLARDARITTLYEGTTGIQAMDLVGRKLLQLRGAGLQAFLGMVAEFCDAQSEGAAAADFVPSLREKAAEWDALSRRIGERAAADPAEAGAAAYDYLMYSGYVALAYWWARSVAAAAARGDADGGRLLAAKRDAARFFFARLLPRTLAHRAAIEAGAATLPELPTPAGSAV
jgi:alkylation response protein AidB-like acyl-CoA dehydrogenase